jgi:hypothetical protein
MQTSPSFEDLQSTYEQQRDRVKGAAALVDLLGGLSDPDSKCCEGIRGTLTVLLDQGASPTELKRAHTKVWELMKDA